MKDYNGQEVVRIDRSMTTKECVHKFKPGEVKCSRCGIDPYAKKKTYRRSDMKC